MPQEYENDEPVYTSAADALRHQQTFNRAEVAWLMALAGQWGYEARVDEENATWPPPKVFTLGRWFDQPIERRKADATARLPRPGDHKGGPAATWGDDDSMQAAA
ncbi:hypothetical protein Ade02nite_20930 [Paractinoplanes deccanensis]|uniref:Uncharacterized protein n=1 Tax=Paractinoplanes deccanensis TaxID=113561 RepID=A0ABQ3Y0E3_9ACTN|nr:hypothetical protein [Actinoplanes deccanensis]GID73452.1 hypothetical protein Ade02nite_20930 [Actinoplanes deccanensis]